MPESGPRSEVFTTVLVRNNGSVADWSAHLNRLHEHAKRLRLSLPTDPPEMTPPRTKPGNSPESRALQPNSHGW